LTVGLVGQTGEPHADQIEVRVYRHILIPTDGSPLSEQAIRHGVAFAKQVGARVTVVTVSETYHTFTLDPLMVADTAETYERDCEMRAARYLKPAQDAAYDAGVSYHGVHVFADHPWEAIIDTAGKVGCDLIVMASHGRKGMSAVLLGSETVKVLTHCLVPVLVCR
jgi:nucleotide-binding universal stress UspA family protein